MRIRGLPPSGKKFHMYMPPPGGFFTPEQRISFLCFFNTFHILQALMNYGQVVKLWLLIFEFKFIKVEYALTSTHI